MNIAGIAAILLIVLAILIGVVVRNRKQRRAIQQRSAEAESATTATMEAVAAKARLSELTALMQLAKAGDHAVVKQLGNLNWIVFAKKAGLNDERLAAIEDGEVEYSCRTAKIHINDWRDAVEAGDDLAAMDALRNFLLMFGSYTTMSEVKHRVIPLLDLDEDAARLALTELVGRQIDNLCATARDNRDVAALHAANTLYLQAKKSGSFVSDSPFNGIKLLSLPRPDGWLQLVNELLPAPGMSFFDPPAGLTVHDVAVMAGVAYAMTGTEQVIEAKRVIAIGVSRGQVLIDHIGQAMWGELLKIIGSYEAQKAQGASATQATA